MQVTWDWVSSRLSEQSTWRGVTALLGAAGITVAPDFQNAIIATVLSVIGLINVIRKEKTAIVTTASVTITQPINTEPKG